MSELYQSLSHSKWDCKYHLVGTSINSKFEVIANEIAGVSAAVFGRSGN